MNLKTHSIAIPTENPGGLHAKQSPHFAYYQIYSLIILKNKSICSIETIPNKSYPTINIHKTIDKLISLKVTILITRGIGLQPLTSLQTSGVQVFSSQNLLTVSDVITAFLKESLPVFPTTPY